MNEGNGRGEAEAARELWAVELGLIEYGAALALQHRLVAAKKAGALAADLLLLLEHPAVITLGRRGDASNVVAPPELLAARAIPVHHVERGGDVTYHGPGQLVGYPIVNLRQVPNRKDVGRFVWVLQEALIRTLQRYNLAAERIEKVVGVWVRRPAPDVSALAHDAAEAAALAQVVAPFAERKIAAIGARVEGWITFHGFALNVNTRLSDFALIVPCGLHDRGVTSMQAELGHAVEMGPVRRALAEQLAALWGHRLVWKRADALAPFEEAPSPAAPSVPLTQR